MDEINEVMFIWGRAMFPLPKGCCRYIVDVRKDTLTCEKDVFRRTYVVEPY